MCDLRRPKMKTYERISGQRPQKPGNYEDHVSKKATTSIQNQNICSIHSWYFQNIRKLLDVISCISVCTKKSMYIYTYVCKSYLKKAKVCILYPECVFANVWIFQSSFSLKQDFKKSMTASFENDLEPTTMIW